MKNWIARHYTQSQMVARYVGALSWSHDGFYAFFCFSFHLVGVHPIHNLAYCYLYYILCVCAEVFLSLSAIVCISFLDQLSAGFITTYSTRLWCMLCCMQCSYVLSCLVLSHRHFTRTICLLLWCFFLSWNPIEMIYCCV